MNSVIIVYYRPFFDRMSHSSSQTEISSMKDNLTGDRIEPVEVCGIVCQSSIVSTPGLFPNNLVGYCRLFF